jgi:hypothetical protein
VRPQQRSSTIISFALPGGKRSLESRRTPAISVTTPIMCYKMVATAK